MIDYEVFKAVVKENFLRYLPEKYRDGELIIQKKKKVNRIMDGLSVLPVDDSRTFLTIYIDEMYEHYRACGDLETVLREAARQYAQKTDRSKGWQPKVGLDAGMEHLKENVIMCLVNTEQNRELLEEVPCRAFHDLSVVYRWVVDETPNAVSSILVSNKVAEMADITEEELFLCAVENTRRIAPVSVKSMKDIAGGMPKGLSVPSDMREALERMERTAENMWIISNEKRIHGAVSMLYEEKLYQLAEKLGDDFFILPSSIHEVIAVPAEMIEENMTNLTKMVQTVNMGSVELEERLSNSVYYYDRTARKVTLAAESPEKRLDGKQTELPLIPEREKKR